MWGGGGGGGGGKNTLSWKSVVVVVVAFYVDDLFQTHYMNLTAEPLISGIPLGYGSSTVESLNKGHFGAVIMYSVALSLKEHCPLLSS